MTIIYYCRGGYNRFLVVLPKDLSCKTKKAPQTSAELSLYYLCLVVANHVEDIAEIRRALEELPELLEGLQEVGVPIRAGSGLYSHLFEHRAQSLKTLLEAVVIHIGSLRPARLGDSPEAREAHI